MTLRVGKVDVKASFKVFVDIDPMETYELQEKLGQGYTFHRIPW